MSTDLIKDRAVTVTELYRMLKEMKKINGDAIVYLEGCDCIGKCNGVESRDNGKQVLLKRFD